MDPKVADAYPLAWPAGWPRAKSKQKANFETSAARARDRLLREIQLMGGGGVILSTNVKVRGDGLMYANFAQPIDTGVAVYFKYKGKPMVFACDRWVKVEDNIHAVELTIAALRGITRWGASDMLERAFQGFAALPAPIAAAHWTSVFNLPSDAPIERIEERHKALVREVHPDLNPNDPEAHNKTAAINQALADARAAKGAAA